MNLLLLEEKDRIEGNRFLVTGERAEHICCVLRSKCGDTVRTGMLGGLCGKGILEEISKQCCVVNCGTFDQEPPAKKNVIPVISLPRPQSFKKTLHFIASSGIGKAYFIGSERVEKSYWKSQSMRPETIREELILGLEQGCDTILPELVFLPDFRDFFKEKLLQSEILKFAAHPYMNAEKCPRAVKEKLLLAIGPEGGYTEREVLRFMENGFRCVTFGPHILRVEFALSFLCGRIEE